MGQFQFKLVNSSPESDNISIEGRDGFTWVTLAAGAGVTFVPNVQLIIPRNYVLEMIINIDNIMVPAVSMHIINCSNQGYSLFLQILQVFYHL